MVIPIHMVTVMILCLLLLALCPRSAAFPLPDFALFPESPLSFCGALRIQVARFAVGAVVDFWNFATMVVAFDVLPGLARLAENGVSIIIFKGADAFDGVGLFLFFGRNRVGDRAFGSGRVQRSGDRIRIRRRVWGRENGGVCHNPTASPVFLSRQNGYQVVNARKDCVSQRACQPSW